MKNINILLLLVVLSCSEKNKRIDNKTDSVKQEKKTNDTFYNNIGNSEHKIKSKVFINYHRDLITAVWIQGMDTSVVSIPFEMDPDKMMTCNNCIFINDDGKYSMVSSYPINDYIFLLPVRDFNRLILFAINFKSKQVFINQKLGDSYLSTSLESIIYNVKNECVIITNGLVFDEVGNTHNIVAHFFTVANDNFLFRKTITVNIPSDLMYEASSMKLTLEKLSEM